MKWIPLSVIIISILIFAISGYAYSQSTLTLQEKCAEGAKRFFFEYKDQYRNGSDYFPDYTSHYNKNLDKCFIHISVFKLTKNGEEESVIHLYNVFEGTAESKTSAYGRFYKFMDRTQPPFCIVGDKICHSEAEFDALIKPYMEE